MSAAVLYWANPYIFSVEPGMAGIFTIIYTVFYPIVILLLLRGTGLVKSLAMPDKKQRIIPYLATSIFYLWFYVNIRDNPDFPPEFVVLLMSGIVCLFMCFFINIWEMVSLHAAGTMALVVNCVLTMIVFSDGYFDVVWGEHRYEITMLVVIVAAFLICGVVSASRLFLKSHTPMQVYIGWLVGVLSPIIALRITDYDF